MRVLLDTHAFFWWSTGNARLKPSARKAISDAFEVYVSAASAWEAAIKTSLGKLRMATPFEEAVEVNGFSKLSVTFTHAAAVAALPTHHTDPFDRVLIALALTEGFTVVTHDPQFRPYDVAILWT